MYSLTLLAAAWGIYAVAERRGDHRKLYETGWIVPVAAAFIVLVVLVSAQAMARSRAGLALTMVALLGAFALGTAHRRRGEGSGLTSRKLLIGAIAVGTLSDSRIPFGRNTIEAAKAYMPFGSGLGTFVPVYGMFEKPMETMANKFVNRAHNDVLELWLETGLAGVALAILFVVWLTLRSREVWRRTPNWGAREIDVFLVRAATMIVALILVHSFVDYPLRTGAMMAIMAFGCALLIRPPVAVESGERAALRDIPEPSARRHRPPQAVPAVARSARAVAPPRSPAAATSASPPNLEWPEAWRSPAGRYSPGAEHPLKPGRLPGRR
jgi:hypothetical protein